MAASVSLHFFSRLQLLFSLSSKSLSQTFSLRINSPEPLFVSLSSDLANAGHHRCHLVPPGPGQETTITRQQLPRAASSGSSQSSLPLATFIRPLLFSLDSLRKPRIRKLRKFLSLLFLKFRFSVCLPLFTDFVIAFVFSTSG